MVWLLLVNIYVHTSVNKMAAPMPLQQSNEKLTVVRSNLVALLI